MAEKDPVPDSPDLNLDTWRALTIASAVLASIICVCFFLWAFFGSYFEPELRIRALVPVVTLSIAAVSFFTIVWRGKISENQNEISQMQLRETQAQNTADLLQRGAELTWEKVEIPEPLGEHMINPKKISVPHQAKVAAGVAILETLAAGENEQFGIQAMNILADFLRENYRNSHVGPLCSSAISALNNANERYPEREADRTIIFDARDETERWKLVTGVKNIGYKNGRFTEFRQPENATRSRNVARQFFMNVRFKGGVMMLPMMARDCTFDKVRFTAGSDIWLGRNTCIACNFSGCRFLSTDSMPDLRATNSYYCIDNPPIAEDNPDIDWTDYLIAKEPGD